MFSTDNKNQTQNQNNNENTLLQTTADKAAAVRDGINDGVEAARDSEKRAEKEKEPGFIDKLFGKKEPSDPNEKLKKDTENNAYNLATHPVETMKDTVKKVMPSGNKDENKSDNAPKDK